MGVWVFTEWRYTDFLGTMPSMCPCTVSSASEPHLWPHTDMLVHVILVCCGRAISCGDVHPLQPVSCVRVLAYLITLWYCVHTSLQESHTVVDTARAQGHADTATDGLAH